MKDGTQELPETSRNTLIELANRLRGGATGRVTIEFVRGGVRDVEYTEKWNAKRGGDGEG